MTCEMCCRQYEDCDWMHLPCGNVLACSRCTVILQWAAKQCETPALEITMERDIRAQVEQVCTTFASFEEIRRLTRQEFRALLRERLQEFGDKCLAVWDEKCGGRDGAD